MGKMRLREGDLPEGEQTGTGVQIGPNAEPECFPQRPQGKATTSTAVGTVYSANDSLGLARQLGWPEPEPQGRAGDAEGSIPGSQKDRWVQPPPRQVDHSAVWEKQGSQEREEGLEQEGAALSLSWVLPLSKPPLISTPWAPNCKMEDQMG